MPELPSTMVFCIARAQEVSMVMDTSVVVSQHIIHLNSLVPRPWGRGYHLKYSIQNFDVHVDYDECLSGNHSCSNEANCNNIDGGFKCTCPKDYFGNGYDVCLGNVILQYPG